MTPCHHHTSDKNNAILTNLTHSHSLIHSSLQDSIQQFFDITRRDCEELDLSTAAKDREMEMLEDNHRVEKRVYLQKVRNCPHTCASLNIP